jgi:hypothetical protein
VKPDAKSEHLPGFGQLERLRDNAARTAQCVRKRGHGRDIKHLGQGRSLAVCCAALPEARQSAKEESMEAVCYARL